MALIKCPECNGDVSDTVASCPHCGYVLNSNAVLPNEVSRSAYDVMLVDYNCTNWSARSALKEYLNCSYSEAKTLLNSLPAYLYTDISKDEAEYIARMLQNKGMRIAVYDPNNNVSYFAPSSYNIPLPVITPIIRRPWFSYSPKKHLFGLINHRPKPMMPRPMGNVHHNSGLSMQNHHSMGNHNSQLHSNNPGMNNPSMGNHSSSVHSNNHGMSMNHSNNNHSVGSSHSSSGHSKPSGMSHSGGGFASSRGSKSGGNSRGPGGRR